MSLHHTPYQTTICRDFVMSKVVHALQMAYADGQIQPVPGTWVLEARGGSAQADDVPPFAHPLVFEDAYKTPHLVFDARPYGRYDRITYEFKITNTLEYGLAKMRAELTLAFIENPPNLLRDISKLPLAIFAAWVSEAVAKRFALEPQEQFKLSVLAGIFYCSQFIERSEFTENEKLRVAPAIASALSASVQEVLPIVDDANIVSSAADFCTKAAAITGSVRLQDLSLGLLYAILGGTWFGANAREMVAVALEHPPTWITILMASFTERAFKNSGITKIVERSSYRQTGKDFERSVSNLVVALGRR